MESQTKKSMMAMRAMEKGLRQCYLPSLAAGDQTTCLIFMGDWNTHCERQWVDMQEAVNEVSAVGCTPNMMIATGTDIRDNCVTFCEGNSWLAALDANVPRAHFHALRDCHGKEHAPVFFILKLSFLCLGRSCLRLVENRDDSNLLAQPRRVQAR